MRKSLSIGKKLSLIVLIMVVVSTAIVGIVSYSLYRRDSIAVHAEKARVIAESVAAAVDGEQFLQIIESNEKTEYWQFTKNYADETIRRTGVAYLYLLGRDYDTQVVYFLEGVDHNVTDACDLGDQEDVSVHADELFETLRTGESSNTALYDAEEYGMMVSGFAAIRTADGATAGVVGVDINVDDVMASSNMFGLFIIGCVVVFSALFWLISNAYIVRGVGQPIANLSAASEKLAKGDMDVSLTVTSGDEIGMLTAAFIEMAESTRKQVAILERLAEGDLTAEITPRSEHDSMSFAMMQTFDRLNHMFGEIQGSAAQVKIGSDHIADEAQLLARGATEQTAAVERLSLNIAEITRKTKGSAEMAAKAALLVETIKQNAQMGSQQMDSMMAAVEEINRAGHDISKVIKVIDDIAFQTNILALNAAVEAAHAGQSGKGFAVVAEEVRGLAAKSAEAAKDSGVLIANSVEKAELGSRIAAETAASLLKIVGGIEESDAIMRDIARSSDEQSQAIKLVHQGIEQVSDVVRQTSATAEESAAASQEMSGQSTMLDELISNFRLRKATKALASGHPAIRAGRNNDEIISHKYR